MFHCLKVIPVWDDMHVMPKTMWKVANPIHWAKWSNVDGHDKIPIPDPSQTGMKLQYQNNKRKMSRHKGRKWIMFVMSSVCARTTSCPTVRITNPDRKKDSSQSGMTTERWKMEEAIRDSDVCWFSKKNRPPLNGCISNEHVINASCRHATNIKGGTTCAIPQLRTKPMCCGTNFNNCHAAQTLWTVGCSIESDPKPKEHVADIQMQVKMWSWDWRRWTSQHHRL